MLKETEILKALGETTRLRIMRLLLETKKEICGCEFVDSLEIPQYNLTKHIDILFTLVSSKLGRKGDGFIIQLKRMGQLFVGLLRRNLKATDNVYIDDLRRFKHRIHYVKEGNASWVFRIKI